MTRIEIDLKTADQIRAGEGPIELVDSSGKPVGFVRRAPTAEEVQRAKDRASRGGPTLTWAQVMARVQAETGT